MLYEKPTLVTLTLAELENAEIEREAAGHHRDPASASAVSVSMPMSMSMPGSIQQLTLQLEWK